jgi:AraC-like DNA-binding protein
MDPPCTAVYETSMSGFMRVNLQVVSRAPMPGWGHKPLARPYWRVYHNADPGWRVEWDGGACELTPERVLLLAPETVYRGIGRTPARHLFVHLTVDGIAPASPGVHVLRFADELAGLVARVDAALSASDWPTGELAAAALGLAAIGRLPPAAFRPTRYSAGIAAAIALAAARAPLPVSVAQLARAAAMHPTAFIRRFRIETGVTPHAWQVRERIGQACLALERGEDSMEEIAERFGFCDRSHFARVFTRVRGVGPGTYRRATLRAGAG